MKIFSHKKMIFQINSYHSLPLYYGQSWETSSSTPNSIDISCLLHLTHLLPGVAGGVVLQVTSMSFRESSDDN